MDGNNTTDEIAIDHPLFGIIETCFSKVNDRFLDSYILGLQTSLYTNFNSDHFLKESQIKKNISSVVCPDLDELEWDVLDIKSYIPHEIHLITTIYDDFSRRSVFEGTRYKGRIKAHQNDVNTVIDAIYNYMGCIELSNKRVEFDFASMDLDHIPLKLSFNDFYDVIRVYSLRTIMASFMVSVMLLKMHLLSIKMYFRVKLAQKKILTIQLLQSSKVHLKKT
ncbi:MAG: hypothetical protein ACLFP2_02420 [Candidatus Woesearchaeota archaeon]